MFSLPLFKLWHIHVPSPQHLQKRWYSKIIGYVYSKNKQASLISTYKRQHLGGDSSQEKINSYGILTRQSVFAYLCPMEVTRDLFLQSQHELLRSQFRVTVIPRPEPPAWIGTSQHSKEQKEAMFKSGSNYFHSYYHHCWYYYCYSDIFTTTSVPVRSNK